MSIESDAEFAEKIIENNKSVCDGCKKETTFLLMVVFPKGNYYNVCKICFDRMQEMHRAAIRGEVFL